MRPLLWRYLVVILAANAQGAEHLLEPAQAFHLQAGLVDHRLVVLEYRIAPGYFLYRDRFKFSADNITLGTPKLPDGAPKHDPIFGTVRVFAKTVEIELPLAAKLTKPAILRVTSQGCTVRGVCFVPYTHVLHITPDGLTSEQLP